jgi:DNA-binding transcriptional MerR regulator
MDVVTTYLSVGDFSRATHISVKMLRHYHSIGLLRPADVDPKSGYRRYTSDQIGSAQVIRRFRDLDMPLKDIRAVLAAPDIATRNGRISAHLDRLEVDLGHTQRAVASLRELLTPSAENDRSIVLQSVPQTNAVVVSEMVAAADSTAWLQGALGELFGTMEAHGATAQGIAGGIYPDDLFTKHRGLVTVFVPCDVSIPPIGRVSMQTVPAAELAVITHAGSPSEVDRAYGALATYVSRHALGVYGPIREYYEVGPRQTTDESQWRTNIGWPIFSTAAT